jgi:hypothetical protein
MVSACTIALLSISVISLAGHAAPVSTDWHAETQFYLTGMMDFRSEKGYSNSWDTVATTVEIKFSSEARPYYGGLFADYRFSSDNHFDDIVNLGVYMKYGLRKWDATSFLFVNKMHGKRDSWLYAGRLRYRIFENHKLGIEAMGSFRKPESPALAFGYYGSLSDALSLNVILDPGVNHGPDFAAHMELVWQVR